MPFEILSLSRRAFLSRALVAGAAAVVPRGLCASAPEPDPDLFALVADCHIAGDRSTVLRGVNMAEHLGGVLGQIAGLPRRPSGVIMAGDLAMLEGRPADYLTLLESLSPIRAAAVPIRLLLGNHDHRENFRAALRELLPGASPLPDRHVGVFPGRLANWFLLDTLDRVNVTPGLMGQAQIEWLARELDARADRPAIVVAHHNPELAGGKSGLVDTAALLETLAPRRHVKAYIFGHTHVWETGRHESGIQMINLPPAAYVFREGRPSGWIACHLRDGGARLTLYTVGAPHPDDGKIFEIEWRA